MVIHCQTVLSDVFAFCSAPLRSATNEALQSSVSKLLTAIIAPRGRQELHQLANVDFKLFFAPWNRFQLRCQTRMRC